MDRCFKCPHWKQFQKGMDGEDESVSSGRDYRVSRLTKERIEAQLRGFRERWRLNYQLVWNPYWFLPVDDTDHENYSPVGRGVRTSDFCAGYRGLMTCRNVEGHKGVYVGSADATGKVVAGILHKWCHKSSCPLCFIRGWSVKLAGDVTARLETAVKLGLGKIEHCTVSVPLVDLGLPEDVLREKSRLALLDRGFEGGMMLFHGYRISKLGGFLYWSVHYHAMGVVGNGGFDRCRTCKHTTHDCEKCDGLKGREIRGFKTDGYLVKVFDERKTIFGTIFYLANHATIRHGFKRFHVVTWFGKMGNRKFAGVHVPVGCSCPACREKMEHDIFVGKEKIVTDLARARALRACASVLTHALTYFND